MFYADWNFFDPVEYRHKAPLQMSYGPNPPGRIYNWTKGKRAVNKTAALPPFFSRANSSRCPVKHSSPLIGQQTD